MAPPMLEATVADSFTASRAANLGRSLAPAGIILVGQAIFFPIHDAPGIYFQGLVFGLLGALVAIGMALIYRANRILNFAQNDLGLVPTVLAVNLIVYSGLNYFLAMFLGLASALLLGAVIELAIIRRFFRAPRLILTVATIGLSQLLTVGALLIPSIWGKTPVTERISLSSDFHFDIRPIRFGLDHLVAVGIAPLALIAVAVFLRYTNVGIGIRASAERSDRASLLGIPVKRLQTVVWALGTVLSFVGVFLRAGVVGLPLVSQVSYTALLAALAALTLGGLTNLPTIATSAVAIGILEQAVSWKFNESPELFDPILAVVIVGGLILRKTGQSRTEHDGASSWKSADEVRPIPKELRRIPEVLFVKWGAMAVGAAFVLWLPTWLGPGNQGLAATVLVFVIIGLSVVVLTGWAGQVSLGQMSFVAVGAAVTGLAISEWKLDVVLAMVMGALAGAGVAVVVGLPALRLRGLFLAVTTLAFSVSTSSYLLNTKHFGWIPKERFSRPAVFGAFDITSQQAYYYFALSCLTVTFLAVRGIRRSRTGRVLLALRENERAVQSYGVSLVKAKLLAFALSGFIAAFAGGLFIVGQQSYTANSYAAQESFNVFTSTVVGGLGSLAGAAVGAVFSRGGTWFLTFPWTLLPSAFGVLFVLMVLRGGLGGFVFDLRDMWLRSVARRNGIVVPSLLADVKQEPIVPAHTSVVAGDVSAEGSRSGESPSEPQPPGDPAIDGAEAIDAAETATQGVVS